MTYRAPETNDSAPLAQQIEQMIDELPGDQVSVGTLLSALGDEGLLLIVILLSAIFIIPVSIPGLSTVFGASILLIGLSRVRNRPLWVPQKLARREIATDKLKANLGRALKWVHRMERLSRPMRLAVMVRSKKMMRLNNLMLVFATLLLMAPAGPIPFSNTLPALALMSFAIGFIQRDGAAVAAGYGFVVATVVYFGVLLGGVPGVPAAEVVILGGGVSGTHAATIAVGMGAKVTVVDRSADALKRLAAQFGTAISTVFSTRAAIEELVRRADLLIGTVLVPGAAAPKLVTHDMVRTMKPGSVIVDVAIDQGGCVETSHATTHSDPTYVVDGVVHYCVANMPGAVARTSTFALNSVTLPFTLALANQGWKKALANDVHLRNGLNVSEGQVTCEPVALAHNLPCVKAETAIGL
jgi:hypothetical protein